MNYKDNENAMLDYINRLNNIERVGLGTEIFRTPVNVYKNGKLIYSNIEILLKFCQTSKSIMVEFHWGEKIKKYIKVGLNTHYLTGWTLMKFDKNFDILEIIDKNIKIRVSLPLNIKKEIGNSINEN